MPFPLLGGGWKRLRHVGRGVIKVRDPNKEGHAPAPLLSLSVPCSTLSTNAGHLTKFHTGYLRLIARPASHGAGGVLPAHTSATPQTPQPNNGQSAVSGPFHVLHLKLLMLSYLVSGVTRSYLVCLAPRWFQMGRRKDALTAALTELSLRAPIPSLRQQFAPQRTSHA